MRVKSPNLWLQMLIELCVALEGRRGLAQAGSQSPNQVGTG